VIALLGLLACIPDATLSEEDRLDLVIPCDVAGDAGLAVRIWRPAEPRYGELAPIFVRTGGLGTVAYQIHLDQGPARAEGAVVVQHIPPGQAGQEASSGGVDDRFGQNWNDGLRCVLAYVDSAEFAEQVPEGAGPRIGTGLSLSGGNLVNVLADDPSLADGAVLWESPLVADVILSELSPGGVADPLFVVGSCSLDGGCPVPGRGEQLRWSQADDAPFEDRDDDGVVGDQEAAYRGMADPSVGEKPLFHSPSLFSDAADLAKPEWWPAEADVEDFWSPRDASAALQDIRDLGSSVAFIYVARSDDHVQVLHEHVRLGQEGLIGADFFRLNPDDAYADHGRENPAGVMVEGVDLSDKLPTRSWEDLVLGAELELADRVFFGTWDVDLDATLNP
jgi:hypothetical protein